MLKYIKWELISFYKKSYKWLIGIFGLYLLVLILPASGDSIIVNLIYLPFGIVLLTFFLGSFLFGTKKIVDTFRNKTFLLESMIPSPPYKILLSKYLMGLIMNLFCVVMLIVGLAVISFRAFEFNLITEGFQAILELETMSLLIGGINLLIYTMSFMSLVTLCFVITKCIWPNRKGSLIICAVIWWVVVYIISMAFNSVFDSDYLLGYGAFDKFSLYNLISIGLIVLYYYITVLLIENKLEIYN